MSSKLNRINEKIELLEARFLSSATLTVAKTKSADQVYKVKALSVAQFPAAALATDVSIAAASITIGNTTLPTVGYFDGASIDVPIGSPVRTRGLPGGGRGTVSVTGTSGNVATFSIAVSPPASSQTKLGLNTKAILQDTLDYLNQSVSYYQNQNTTNAAAKVSTLQAQTVAVTNLYTAVDTIAQHRSKQSMLPASASASTSVELTPASLRISDQMLAACIKNTTAKPATAVRSIAKLSVHPANELGSGIAFVTAATSAIAIAACLAGGVSVGATLGAIGAVVAGTSFCVLLVAAGVSYLAGNPTGLSLALGALPDAAKSFVLNYLPKIPIFAALEAPFSVIDTFNTFADGTEPLLQGLPSTGNVDVSGIWGITTPDLAPTYSNAVRLTDVGGLVYTQNELSDGKFSSQTVLGTVHGSILYLTFNSDYGVASGDIFSGTDIASNYITFAYYEQGLDEVYDYDRLSF